jgi:glycosyltransferase involved in cell wall biosynthesis
MPTEPRDTPPSTAHDRPDLGVAICTRNNIRTIGRSLQSVADLARRIVIVDSGSSDGTIERCREYGAEIIDREWHGPTNQKQYAIDHCRDHRWVLLLDSDESLEPELQASMRDAIHADDPAFDAWAINRKIWFAGAWLNHTFQPEWRVRLMRGGAGRVVGLGPDGRGGHDRVEVDGRVGRLHGVCRHDSWADLEEMSRRNIELARRAAEFAPRGGTIWHLATSPAAAFIKQYIIKRGVLDGWRGLVVAGGAASAALLKHQFIAERRATGEAGAS